MTFSTLTIGVARPKKSSKVELPYARTSAQALAHLAGAKAATLLDGAATRAAVRRALAKLAETAPHGKVFVSFSGHGRAFGDDQDAWQLFDGPLASDEIVAALGKFARGVEVVVVSDCCFSGGIVSGPATKKLKASVVAIAATGPDGLAFPEAVPPRKKDVSALTAALVKAWRPAGSFATLEAKLRKELATKTYQQAPRVETFGP